jgi:hypothetical protein
MEDVSADQLKRVIELQHGGTGVFVQSVRVHKTAAKGEWDGVVHVFDLKDNPKANRAYAWAAPIKGGTKPRYFAVLHQGRIKGPADAVKAAAAAIEKWGAGAG